ncbi:MAG: DUF488 family protein [Desulfovibrionaceae bacterium]
MSTTIYTIGFTGKSAREFFELLRRVGVRKVIDVRLKNVSQLSGFTKREDLRYFLDAICTCGYEHRPEWAPTEEILHDFKKKIIGWEQYEERFQRLMDERMKSADVSAEGLDRACLLCSEPTAKKCHRRLVAERLQSQLKDAVIFHL